MKVYERKLERELKRELRDLIETGETYERVGNPSAAKKAYERASKKAVEYCVNEFKISPLACDAIVESAKKHIEGLKEYEQQKKKFAK